MIITMVYNYYYYDNSKQVMTFPWSLEWKGDQRDLLRSTDI